MNDRINSIAKSIIVAMDRLESEQTQQKPNQAKALPSAEDQEVQEFTSQVIEAMHSLASKTQQNQTSESLSAEEREVNEISNQVLEEMRRLRG